MQWEIVAQTHVGKVRKKNEDAHLVVKDIPLLVVADGMGGMSAGDVASGMIVEQLSRVTPTESVVDMEPAVTQALQRAHDEILAYSRDKLAGNRAGSTVVLLALGEPAGFCHWVGDSRLYRVRNNVLTQLTSDHSQVNEMLKQGMLTSDEARMSSLKNILTHAVGVHEELFMERVEVVAEAGDTYLLCSDGLYNEMSDTELQEILAGNDIYRSSVRLANLCLRRGARDNFTFVICRCSEAPLSPAVNEDTQITHPASERTHIQNRDDEG